MQTTSTVSCADTQDLPTLTQRIRDEHRAAQAAGGALLHHAMNAGDALIAAQAKVSGNWKSWLRQNCCFLSVPTALVYQRLAKRRGQIEAELERAGVLSLRAALRLTAEPKGKTEKKTKDQPTLLAHWMGASGQERMALLDEIGVDGLRKAASLDLYRQLKEQLHIDRADSDPDTMITTLLRKALSHVAAADAPQTSDPVADANIAEALNSLRGALKKLGAIDRDYHDVVVGLTAARAKRRRAA
jgi:hypothetical protein